LIRHFRPQLEAKVKDYAKQHGAEPLAGGWEPDAGKKGILVSPGM
jgi:NADH dehydrogenase (ubiquinone) flavoprotein 1